MNKASSQRENHFSKREKVYGQFFTPPLIADFIVKFALLHLDTAVKAIDPACGDGVFLRSLLDAGFKEVVGVDVDQSVLYLIPSSVRSRARIIIMDALIRSGLINERIPENYFDLVVGNPPFSSKYGRVSDSRLLQYELGRGRSSQAIEVLFLERFIQLARENGVIGIILPEGVFANENLKYVREYILRYKILAVVSLPRGVFRGTLSTSSKTYILFLKKTVNDGGDVLMVEINSLEELSNLCGNVKLVYEKGVWVKPRVENLTPRFYMSSVEEFLFKEKLEIKTLSELVDEVKTGSTEYGVNRKFSETGLKYISAKVVTPLGLDFSKDRKFIEPGSKMDKPNAYVKPGDLLFVRVGVGCSGRACVAIDNEDTGVADDWIYIIRLKDRELLPYYVAIYIHSRFGKMQIERMKRGVGTVNIPKKKLLELKIPIPSQDFLKIVKEKYITMVHKLRAGDRREAERIFSDLVNLVEKTITTENSTELEQSKSQ